MSRCRAVRAGIMSLAIALLVAIAPASADLLYFAEGGEARLPVEIEGDIVQVITPDGSIPFQTEDFRAIVPGFWPEHEWPGRRRQAEAGDASDRFRAAWWAIEHGLTLEGVALLRAAHQLDPTLEPAPRLVSILDHLNQPAQTPNLTALRKVLRSNFKVSETPRLLLLHQHDDAEATERLALLDRIVTTFYLTFTTLGFELRVPSEKLVAVWFAEESDYRAFVRREAGDAFLTTRGYYHPTRRVVFVSDSRSRPEFQRSTTELRRRLDELDQAERSLADVPPSARFRLSLSGERSRAVNRSEAEQRLDALRRDTQRKLLLQTLEQRRSDQAAAVHELVHQLVIASGLAPQYDQFPIWLHEGIAMQFEAFRGDQWAGLAEAPSHRIDQWRRLRSVPAIDAIVRDQGFGQGYAPAPYAAAWALVFHLRTKQPEGFIAVLDQLRNPRSGNGDQGAAAFQAVFGQDPENLRREWIENLRTLRTPIEENAPPRSRNRSPGT
ncbi:DUF1570 domain-containing protein [Tautonia marina]|uniref:DUF1570 domain-containing protein n=1 Tax=Tautonia marina TaxID=2653855 RepID=UPI00137604F9|nr:DUF1570 domain-containing protein [Tautonia marina]